MTLATPPTPEALAERRFLNESELANRWGISPKTLQRWRSIGQGPVFARFSRKIAYPIDGPYGILDYEKHALYCSTSERVSR